MAVIFINKLDKDGKQTDQTTGLCLQCAKKQGIDPLANIMKEMTNMSEEDIENMSTQFDTMFNGLQDTEGEEFDEFDERPGISLPNIFSNFMPKKEN